MTTNTENEGMEQAPATAVTGARAGGCCGGAAPAGVDACCALDAEMQSTGGCGCAPQDAAKASEGCC